MTTQGMPMVRLSEVGKVSAGRRAWKRAKLNTTHYLDNEDELWAESRGDFLVVYDEACVQSFDSITAMCAFIDQLPPESRRNATYFPRPRGVPCIL